MACQYISHNFVGTMGKTLSLMCPNFLEGFDRSIEELHPSARDGARSPCNEYKYRASINTAYL